jgi:hypothetical protein
MPSAREPTSLHTTVSTILSRHVDLSLPPFQPRALTSCLAYLWAGADTHDPSTIATLLPKHLGDYDGKDYEVIHVEMQQGQ